ncbi:unnamed protein product [Tuber aestivum]|uniref:Saccharopine dehydrogenase [NAD(+), L-lysine-forming] n=1 Tax=Tuber aestivum TaxID=59557 RepID=A0A292Q040_9PEZI|nr:unnamed protein product [Tuber aestivum]
MPVVTPTTASALLGAGYDVRVERSEQRIFGDSEFEKVCATLVPKGSWTEAPTEHIIIGLKELPKDDYLEFLQDDSGRRVAAFGYHAGSAGAALGVEAWAWPHAHPGEEFRGVKPYPSEDALVSHVKSVVTESSAKIGRNPKILVIGALGRCGKAAVDLALKVGVPAENVLQWDMAETAKGGPFVEIVESDIFINCIYLNQPVPPFIDTGSLENPDRKLSVVVDVSCDTTNPHNPIPIYSINTTFGEPTVPVPVSEAFSKDLLPSLLSLKDRKSTKVWAEAEKLFHSKVATLSGY